MKKNTNVTKPPEKTTTTSTAPVTPAVPSVATSSTEGVAASTSAFPITGLTMFRMPEKGWTLLKLRMQMTTGGPEILSWETIGEETQMPKTHADNLAKVFMWQHFLGPEAG